MKVKKVFANDAHNVKVKHHKNICLDFVLFIYI